MTETSLPIEQRRLERRRVERRRRFGNVLALALGLAIAAGGMFALVRAAGLRDAVLPGVSAAGIDLGGLERAQAEARLAAEMGARLDRPVTVTVASKTFRIAPGELFEVDAAATVALAYEQGRDSFGDRLGAALWPSSVSAELVPVLRERPGADALLGAALEDVVRRPVSARVEMDGTRPVVRSGKPGLGVKREQLLAELRAAALGGGTAVTAPLVRVKPPITTPEAREAAAQAETVVGAPVFLTLEGKEIGRLRPWQLAPMVRFQPMSAGYQVALDQDRVIAALGPLVEPFVKQPKDATFKVVSGGKKVAVVQSEGGTRLAAAEAPGLILAAALTTTDRTAEVVLAKQQAAFTTQEALVLGIREPIASFTSDMGPSSANRIHNVHLLGDFLDGTIVLPKQVFSFNKVVGPRTAERGFLEGQAIVNGVLVASIGGGVCQTATTVFNAAFDAGLPIIERHNHSYYIDHYPIGRDATVAWGGYDLRFGNDLESAILIKVGYTDSTFTVTFYGTDQGRKVVATTGEQTRFTEPRLVHAIDPGAEPKSVRESTSSGPGFDIAVHRKVVEDGKVLRETDFETRYTSLNPTKVYGPGAGAPPDAIVLPDIA